MFHGVLTISYSKYDNIKKKYKLFDDNQASPNRWTLATCHLAPYRFIELKNAFFICKNENMKEKNKRNRSTNLTYVGHHHCMFEHWYQWINNVKIGEYCGTFCPIRFLITSLFIDLSSMSTTRNRKKNRFFSTYKEWVCITQCHLCVNIDKWR